MKGSGARVMPLMREEKARSNFRAKQSEKQKRDVRRKPERADMKIRLKNPSAYERNDKVMTQNKNGGRFGDRRLIRQKADRLR